MNDFGIYKVRLPRERVSQLNNPFYDQIQSEIEGESELIYKENNIVYPEIYIGMNLMGNRLNDQNIIEYL